MGVASPASFGTESRHSAWRPAGAEPMSELHVGGSAEPGSVHRPAH